MRHWIARPRLGIGAAAFLGCLLATAAGTSGAADKAEAKVDFLRDVRPILAKRCFACHGPDEESRQAELRLDTQEGAFAKRPDGAAFVVGKPDESVAWKRIRSSDPDERMPPPKSGPPLTEAEQALIQGWIAQGGAWQTHWAFVKPARPAPPATKDTAWARSPLDRFVLARLEAAGLRPAPEADKRTLLRRVALDLTGLPAPPDAAAEFLADDGPQAYERLVDRLLKSEAYGERWARVWLDLARYADTRGYEKDRTRTIWRYRDWVIDAFNSDLPYDQFTRDQLAGDLLPAPTVEQLLATAMHRNTLVNEEGGTDDEEFRVAAVKDRVDTTIQVWMGLTMGCAKCHSHKYDPISQREYYQFYAFFNQTEDSDKGDERPTASTPTAQQRRDMEAIDAELARLTGELARRTAELEGAAAAWARTRTDRRGWSVLTPDELKAESGATLKTLDDRSVLAGGPLPGSEQYRLAAPLDLPALTGLRLEALPDASQPRGGVGRSKDDGNFVLTGMQVELRLPDGTTRPVTLTKAVADYAQQGYPVDHVLKNPDPTKHGWAVSPQQTKPHVAVFTVDAAVEVPRDARLVVTLDHRFQFAYPGFALGRFRLSATNDPQPSLEGALPDEIGAIVRKAEAERTPDERRKLAAHYAREAPETADVRKAIADAETRRKSIQPVQTPVLRELPEDKRRTTKLHVRGNFLEQSDEVRPAAPSAFHAWPAGAPLNRLGVAAWLASPDNPLTARVAVNRIWSQLFGLGLVETEEDFGSQGAPPAHPELLDWLAVEFMAPESGATPWSWKGICKTIVMSAVYRQSSRVSPELAARDRDNRLLARGARFRLDAETLRDQALAVSGLLSSKMYGPSVMPPQPDGIWRSTYNTDKWVTSAGEDRYRRGLYTFVKRTSPHPAMTTFDAPSREICTIRRVRTNTPLQSLVLLNDPAFVECAQALARSAAAGGGTAAEKAGRAFERAIGRPATAGEIAALVGLYERRLVEFRADPDAARKFASDPLGPPPAGADPVDLAALTAVANVILNLDEFLTRG